eukprot:CAMPEP_0182468714 /NCGR_PEP_ID=MMETSP1319-20130603/15920_1 /TAXON_ID=172717 /ORGANISM="Bolidomonas pacifica, Strain RCC208" /LENGTH=214 /DNA_ID=CAMNT_0024668943 /DNA_START=109 /DNA_END=750 /DNA_ORIENTATION=+
MLDHIGLVLLLFSLSFPSALSLLLSRRSLLLSPFLLPPSLPSTPYDGYAKTYDSLDGGPLASLLSLDVGRAALLSRVRPGSTVLELGAGTGLNLPYYPEGLSSLALVDSSREMLKVASSKPPPPSALRPTRYLVADVTSSDSMSSALPDGEEFDYVVDTFSLCVLGQEGAVSALRNARARLKRGGEILLFENSRSSQPLIAAYQDLTAEYAAEN